MPQTDKFGRHEVLHMSSFLCDIIDRELMQHGAVKKKKKWLALADKAHTALFDLYQAIGKETLD